MNTPAYAPLTDADFARAFPNSRKIHVEGANGVRVPMREIALSGGEPPTAVYDTSGPRVSDLHAGLPPLREPWITSRGDVEIVQSTGAGRSMADDGRPRARTVLRGKPGAAPTQL